MLPAGAIPYTFVQMGEMRDKIVEQLMIQFRSSPLLLNNSALSNKQAPKINKIKKWKDFRRKVGKFSLVIYELFKNPPSHKYPTAIYLSFIYLYHCKSNSTVLKVNQ